MSANTTRKQAKKLKEAKDNELPIGIYDYLIYKEFPKNKLWDFARFAFGPGFQSESGDAYRRRWNELHGTKYLINPESHFENSIDKMVELYYQAKNCVDN